MLTEAQLRQILPLLPLDKLQQYLPHLNAAMQAYEINTLLRTAAFIAQTAHESAQFTRTLESMNYSKAAGIRATWPSRFSTEESALPYVRNEPKLGNFVYADRMGNGNSASGDGFLYRGRGVIQLTGRDGYRSASKVVGQDLEANPELARNPEIAFTVAANYWKGRGLNALADVPDFKTITQRINNGQKGAAERVAFFETAQRVLASGFVADAPLTRGARRSPMEVVPVNLAAWSRGWQDSAEPAVPPQAATKKAVGAKAPAKKATAKKAPAKKAPAKKAAAAKKLAVKTPPAKKAVAKKTVAKKAIKRPAKRS